MTRGCAVTETLDFLNKAHTTGRQIVVFKSPCSGVQKGSGERGDGPGHPKSETAKIKMT